MTLEKFRFDNKKPIRKAIHEAFEKADRLHEMEQDLIRTLRTIDSHRYFVFVGYKSLMGFCDHALRFSRTQSYRIVTLVRRPAQPDPLTADEVTATRAPNANLAVHTNRKSGGMPCDERQDREEDSSHRWPSENYSGKYGGPW